MITYQYKLGNAIGFICLPGALLLQSMHKIRQWYSVSSSLTPACNSSITNYCRERERKTKCDTFDDY